MRLLIAGFVSFVIAIPSIAQERQGGRAFTPADWYAVRTVGSPAVSPDGRLVAFTLTTVKEAENKRHSEIWVVPADGGEPVRYTSPSFSSTNPRFSADGRLLLFRSERPGGKGQTWAIRMDGPRGEAFQMDYPEGSTPRDRRFAVWTDAMAADSSDTTRADDLYRRMQPVARPPHEAITRPLDPARFDGRHIVHTRYKANNTGFIPGPRGARTWRPSQLWIQSFDGSPKRALTATSYSHREVAVSPDGRWVAFTADPELRPDSVVSAIQDSISLLPYDRERDGQPRNDADIFIMPIDGGAPRRLTTMPGTEVSLQWSPDGRSIAYISRTARTHSARLYFVDVAGGEPRDLLGDWQYEPLSYAWHPGGQITMSAAIGGRTALFAASPRSGAMRELLGGRRRLSGFSYDQRGRLVAYVATSTNRPAELYVSGIDGRNERRLTAFNDSISNAIAFADAERFTFTSVGGLEIEAWLMRPYGYEAGRKYPLVLYIHGGPHSAYGENWFDEFQNIAGAGMWVLYTNPRGSSGYGAQFTYSTRGRWGLEDYEDIMRAVDIAAARPDVDSLRMGVTGGSYGGFMTAWITTRTHRFRAAQTDRMISNWISWYGTADVQQLTEFEFFGKPWDNLALYDTLSPIRYANQVRTPTLIVQSEEDHRTPMGDAEQWFMALRKHGVPVEFIRYPRSTHDLSRTGEPWLLVDRLARLRQWFAHWLQDELPVRASERGRTAGSP